MRRFLATAVLGVALLCTTLAAQAEAHWFRGGHYYSYYPRAAAGYYGGYYGGFGGYGYGYSPYVSSYSYRPWYGNTYSYGTPYYSYRPYAYQSYSVGPWGYGGYYGGRGFRWGW